MEEKKKRWRPSVREYRDLQSRYEGLQSVLKGLGDVEGVIRDNQCYRQMIINAVEMLRHNKFNPAVLCQGTSECNDLCRILHRGIVEFRRKHNHDGLIKLLEEKEDEIARLKNIGFWKRVFPKFF